MRAITLTVCAAIAAGWAGTLMSVGGVAAGADAEILLNRRWAEQGLTVKSSSRPTAILITYRKSP